MELSENLKNQHQRNIDRGLTFEVEPKEEESEIEQEAKHPKRNMERARPMRTARLNRRRKRT